MSTQQLDTGSDHEDANPELTLRYRVLGLPFMALFSGGELVTSVTGAVPKSRLLGALDAALTHQ